MENFWTTCKGNFVLSRTRIQQDGWCFSGYREPQSLLLLLQRNTLNRTPRRRPSRSLYNYVWIKFFFFLKILGLQLGRLKEWVQPALSFNVPLFYSSRCNQHFMNQQWLYTHWPCRQMIGVFCPFKTFIEAHLARLQSWKIGCTSGHKWAQSSTSLPDNKRKSLSADKSKKPL